MSTAEEARKPRSFAADDPALVAVDIESPRGADPGIGRDDAENMARRFPVYDALYAFRQRRSLATEGAVGPCDSEVDPSEARTCLWGALRRRRPGARSSGRVLLSEIRFAPTVARWSLLHGTSCTSPQTGVS